MTSNGFGAWYQVYQRGVGIRFNPLVATERDRFLAAGVRGIRRELLYRGYNVPLKYQFYGYYGKHMEDAVRLYQSDNALQVDGVVGFHTAQSLFAFRALAVTSIPDDLVAKLMQEESAWDPGAQGFVDVDDHGLAQINFTFHPKVTLAQAASGEFCVQFVHHYLREAHDSMHDWDAAVASYNVGFHGAHEWLEAGKPAGPIADYVVLVRGQKL